MSEPLQEENVTEGVSEAEQVNVAEERPGTEQEAEGEGEASDSEKKEYNEEEWIAEQLEIAEQVQYDDENDWSNFFTADGFEGSRDLFIAGADISFSTTITDFAVGTLTVVKLRTDRSSELVFSRSGQVDIPYPYVPSFLAFREAPMVSFMFDRLPKKVRSKIDCLLLDGNGVLHPRKAGLACHVGLDLGIPTIGVSKSLLCVDGLDEKEVRQQVAAAQGDIEVIGKSNFVWGRAILTGNAETKPIYVSVGHRVSLTTASRVVKSLCEYRIPSPIRFADMHSRALLRDAPVEVYELEAFL